MGWSGDPKAHLTIKCPSCLPQIQDGACTRAQLYLYLTAHSPSTQCFPNHQARSLNHILFWSSALPSSTLTPSQTAGLLFALPPLIVTFPKLYLPTCLHKFSRRKVVKAAQPHCRCLKPLQRLGLCALYPLPSLSQLMTSRTGLAHGEPTPACSAASSSCSTLGASSTPMAPGHPTTLATHYDQ